MEANCNATAGLEWLSSSPIDLQAIEQIQLSFRH